MTHFKITSIANGTLFQNDGTTPIADGTFLTFAQANAGLRFTPAPNFFGTASFAVQAATGNTDGGLGGATATVDITVTAGGRHAVGDQRVDHRQHADDVAASWSAATRPTAPR